MGKEFEKEKPKSVLTQLIDRHESLRTSFKMIGEHPVQQIHDKISFDFEYIELEIEDPRFTMKFIRPFDLGRAPLMRSILIRLPDGNHLWLTDIHHIITDGTSNTILQKEFMALYKGEKLKPNNTSYTI